MPRISRSSAPASRRTLLILALAATWNIAGTALATFHEWRFAEFYSNASGTVQFIEMADAFDGEVVLGGKTLQSGGHTFTFPANLPTGTPTAGHRLLLATPGYFNLSGVPKADYNLGVNSFFSTAGDSLNFASGIDTFAFAAGALPLDSLNALVRTTPSTGSPTTTAVNSPTNVGGTSGAFPRWENQDDRFNVSGQGGVTLQDAIIVINDILAHGTHVLAAPAPGASPPPYYDVTGDNRVTLQDAVQMINRILAAQAIEPQISVAPPLAGPLVMNVPEPPGIRLALCAALVAVCFVAARRRKRAVQPAAWHL